MSTAVFLQSETADPYAHYSRMLAENPVFWDAQHNCWVIYGYEDCKQILSHSRAYIPALPPGSQLAGNEYVQLIRGKLVRLSNPPIHQRARQMTVRLFAKMRPIDLPEIIDDLLSRPGTWVYPNVGSAASVNWVASVCRKLPVSALLKSFNFSAADSAFVLSQMEQLVKIMAPAGTPEQIDALNTTAAAIYQLTERHVLSSGLSGEIIRGNGHSDGEDSLARCIGNLIGLFIQSYDAGRGLLSNSLLQLLDHVPDNSPQHRPPDNPFPDDHYFHHCVIETLRYDPPVQHTRRVAAEDLFIRGSHIQKGQSILVILAAANRDPEKFADPGRFDPYRSNKEEHLTYGAGLHRCPAREFATELTATTLHYFFRRYTRIVLTDRDIRYEPLANLRLPAEIFLSVS